MPKVTTLLIAVLLGVYSLTFHAQNNLPNDCTSAILVCGDGAISSNAMGAGMEEINSLNSCNSYEHNSIWLKIEIAQSGTLGFTLTPTSTDIQVDYDFFIFGPNASCNNLGTSIRCSTTNPYAAGSSSNITGMNETSTEDFEGPGPDGDNFVRQLDVKEGETYFLVIDRPIGNSAFELEWNGTAIQNGDPFPEGVSANIPEPLVKCTIHNQAEFDIFSKIEEIRTNTSDTVTFYATLANANDQTNPLDQYFKTSSSTTIFARVSNPQVECYEIVELDLTVNNGPPVQENVMLTACDIQNDNNQEFDLNSLSPEILNNLDEENYNITFHRDSISAINNSNLIPENYTSTPTKIYARITEINDSECFSISTISLQLNPVPITNDYTLIQCDVDPGNSTDGITNTNLTEANDFIANTDSSYTYSYFRNQADFNNNIPIENPARFLNNISFQQNLIIRVQNENTGCYSTSKLFLEIQPTTTSLPKNGSYYTCDISENNTEISGNFNLEKIAAESYPNLEVNFYGTLEDASLEANALPEEYTTPSTRIYVRLERLNQCQGIESIELIVRENPKIQLEDTYNLCLNEGNLQIKASNFSSHEWQKESSGTYTTIGSGSALNVNEPGHYKLIATNTANGVSCSSAKEFDVEVSNIATISRDPEVNDISNNNIVTLFAEGEGDYEYAVESPENFQDNNTFENVPSGFVTFYVRDKNGCGIIETEIAIIGYDKFFTPNNDGSNDYWKIKGINTEIQAESDIQIYDRYGVLVARIQPEDAGWDGTFNGRNLPENDYWFKVELENGKIFKGHFSLMR